MKSDHLDYCGEELPTNTACRVGWIQEPLHNISVAQSGKSSTERYDILCRIQEVAQRSAGLESSISILTTLLDMQSCLICCIKILPT